MNAVADGIVALDATFEETMTFCLNCRACEAVCPSLVPFGRAMEGARAELTAQRPSLSRRLRHLAVGRLLPSRPLVRTVTVLMSAGQRLHFERLLRGKWSRALKGLRRLRKVRDSTSLTQSSRPTRGTAALLRGCVMEPWFPAVNRAAVDLLSRAGYRVTIPEQQTCCGALAAHDGDLVQARRLAERNEKAFAAADLVVATAAGCSAHLKEYDHLLKQPGRLASKAKDVTEVIAGMIDEGALPTLDQGEVRVAVQDPCHLRHAQRITRAPRLIITAAGLQPVEIDADGLCCGAAGIYSLLRPEASAQLGARKAAQVTASHCQVVASANPGCEMQLRAHLGPGYEIAHPIELYWQAALPG
jgi:glycolate oxidase iron-sulfur subunit